MAVCDTGKVDSPMGILLRRARVVKENWRGGQKNIASSYSGDGCASVSILCQHHELPDGTICQKGRNIDAAKLLIVLQT